MNGCSRLTPALAVGLSLLAAGVSAQPGAPGAAPAGAQPVAVISEAQVREHALAILTEAASAGTPELRANAIEGLVPVPSRLEPVLPRALTDTSSGVRAVAAMAAGKAGVASAAEFIRPLLNDPSPLVRASAILGMTKLAMSPAGRRVNLQAPDPSPLAGMLWSRDPREVAQAAFVLGELGNTTALPMLKEARRQPMARTGTVQRRVTQLQIAEAMAKLGDDSVLGDIRAGLYPSSPDELEVAALAAQITGQVGDKQSILQLDYLAKPRPKDDAGAIPGEVRLAAAAAISKLGDPMGLPTADEYLLSPMPELRAAAAMVYGELGLRSFEIAGAGPGGSRGMVEVIPKLAGLLEDTEVRVRVSAAAAVLKITDRQSGR